MQDELKDLIKRMQEIIDWVDGTGLEIPRQSDADLAQALQTLAIRILQLEKGSKMVAAYLMKLSRDEDFKENLF